MTYWEIILIALSLSVDTLAVTVSSSMSLKKAQCGRIVATALSFGILQAMLLFIGWLCGQSVMDYIYKFAGIVGFVMLLYIGVSMMFESLKKGDEAPASLSGFRAVFLAGIATSIDAAAVGVSFAMTEIARADLYISLAIVFLITFLTALAGICGGKCIGSKFGRPAQVVGGIVLILIGLRILLGEV